MTSETTNPILKAAQQYHRRGWRCIPIRAGGKRPRIKWKRYQDCAPTLDELQEWFGGDTNNNIGIVTGKGSGLVAVDVDSEEARAAIEDLCGDVVTPTVVTSRGHHFLFRYPEGGLSNSAGVAFAGVDVRGDGGYVVAPPSVHADGSTYRWDTERDRGLELDLAPMPQALLARLQDSQRSNVQGLEGGVSEESIPEGRRNDTLTSIAGRFLGQGSSKEDTLVECLRINQSRCSPPLAEDEVRDIVDSIAAREDVKRVARQGTTIATVSMADVRAEKVDWLWTRYVPRGKLTMIDGDPGAGKSSVTLDLAARVSSSGTMPDGSSGLTGNVLLICQEDGLGDTVRPRLETMGANLNAVQALTEAGQVLLPRDTELLADMMKKDNLMLIIIDPLAAHVSREYNLYIDQHVRLALGPLLSVAQMTGTAIIGVRHLNKKEGGSAMQRGGGSIAIIGIARAGYVIGKHPKDPETRVLASVKHNLGVTPPSLRFGLEGAGGVAKVVWGGPCTLTADDLVADWSKAQSRIEEAMGFVKATLAEGEKPSSVVRGEAEQLGIKEKTLKRARTELGIEARRGGSFSGGKWMLSLPESPDYQGGSDKDVTPLEENRPPSTDHKTTGTKGVNSPPQEGRTSSRRRTRRTRKRRGSRRTH